jgi:signal-transduction protein with cAMP-binding, CBS, and nucleotidyltransferase domain
MAIVTIIDFVKKVEWFEENKITGTDLNDLSSLVTYEHYKPGEAIFKFGQPNDKMYIIIDG